MGHAFLESRALISVKAGFRPDIQSLRAVAVLAVIAFHISPKLFPSGYLGVDLFFVISGFVITPLIVRIFHFERDEQFKFSAVVNRLIQFYKRRFLRLTPAVGVMFLIGIPILVVLGDFSLIERLANQSIASLLLLGNFGAYKFAGDYFNPGISNPFIHTWSLSVEEQFYVFFPILLLIFALIPVVKNRSKTRTSLVLIAVGTISMFLFLNSNALIPFYSKFFAVPQAFAFYSPITRLWQFALGGLISLHLSSTPSLKKLSKVSKFVTLIGLFLVLFISFGYSQTIEIITISLFATAAITFQAMDLMPKKINNLLQWIGDRSYSIYLAHLPLIYLFLESPYSSNLSKLIRAVLYPLVFLLIFICGDLMFRKIEERFRVSPGAETKTGTHYKIGKIATFFQIAPLALSLAVLLTTNQGFFGLVAHSSISQEGDTFQKYCVRETFVRQFPCRFDGPVTGKKILLLGDSHASQYAIDIWKLGIERGYEVYFGGDFGGEVDSRKTHEVVTSMHPNLIIVSKYWKVQDGELRKGMKEDLKQFNLHTKKIIIIGQNPIFKVSKTRQQRGTLLTAIKNDKPNLGNRVERFKDLDTQALISGNAIREFSKEQNFEFLDPFPLYCSKISCRRWGPSGCLYIDNNHLSTLGASKMKEMIGEAI